jgi:transglutaminase-like putative cysteine protease
MSIKNKALITIFILFIALIGIYLLVNKKQQLQPQWDIKRVVRYAFQLENKSNKPLTNVVFKTYAPLAQTSTQRVIDIESSHPFNKIDTEFGNQVLEFDIEFIPPYGKKKIQITAELVLSEILAPSSNDFDFYLLPQPQIESKHQFITKIAKQFDSKSSHASENIFYWVVDNVEYTGYGQKDKGASYAAKFLQGDCTEFAYLNTAINRANGIPSRAVNGYVVEHDAKLNAFDFHTWSEVWKDNTWINIDPQKSSYMENQFHYIAMNIVTDQINKEKPFKRFWVSNPKLIVTMK